MGRQCIDTPLDIWFIGIDHAPHASVCAHHDSCVLSFHTMRRGSMERAS